MRLTHSRIDDRTRCRYRDAITAGRWWPHYRARVSRAATGRVLEIGVPRELVYEHVRFLAVVPARDVVIETGTADVIVDDATEQLPFASGTFDVVVCTLSLCSAKDPSVVVGEIGRVLRPYGHVEFLEHSVSTGRFGRRNGLGSLAGDRCRAASDPLVLLLGGGLVFHRADLVQSGAARRNPLVCGVAVHARHDEPRDLGALLGGRNTGS